MKKTFSAIRFLTRGNLLFSDKLIVDTTLTLLTYKKRNFYGIGHDEIILRFKDIISYRIVSRIELLLFCDIEIETRGGRIIKANGFWKKDAEEIQKLIGF